MGGGTDIQARAHTQIACEREREKEKEKKAEKRKEKEKGRRKREMKSCELCVPGVVVMGELVGGAVGQWSRVAERSRPRTRLRLSIQSRRL